MQCICIFLTEKKKKAIKRPFWEQRMYSHKKKCYEQRTAQTFRPGGAFYIKAHQLSFLID